MNRTGKPSADGPLRLLAQDAADLAVLSAVVQDAVVKVGDMAYQPRRRRFAMVVNRYRWERDRPGGRGERVRAGLHFDSVLGVRTQGVDRAQAERVLELLTIASEPREEGAAEISLLFAGGAVVRLDAECIDAQFADLSAPWAARMRPRHDVD